ncbi:MAG: hypothetical protein JST14_15710 [Bacteroidetes bacterium]|nr:hypothetical protein [Bacteroidota bacterium]
MKRRLIQAVVLISFWSLMLLACKKSDPAPLGAQTNAVFLAGQTGKSKSWKLREYTYQIGTQAAQTLTLQGCFSDNLYTFTNNATQDYAATEGASKCYTGDPDGIENGSWAFSLDGLTLSIEVSNTQSANGLFTAEPSYYVGDTTTIKYFSQLSIYPYNIGTPYPAFVKKIDDNNLVLEMNYKVGSTTYKYTMTFTPA